ncbi:MAG: hypothetical protein M3N51_12140, partial [Actinomycetota bacterium]|nr:hypothetical protein [Actinomycetota bacterium]
MSGPQVLALAVAAVAILGMVAVFAIAFRREESTIPPAPRLDRRTRRRDRSRMEAVMVTTPSRTEESQVVAPEELEPPRPVEDEEEEPEAVQPVEVRREEEVPPEEAGVTRRQFFNRALLAAFGAYMALTGTAMLAFFWPRLGGGFGADIDAGEVDDLLDQLQQDDGTIDATAGYVPEARAYVVPFSEEELQGTAYEGLDVVAGGVAALYQRCVHLGCRVPWCDS